ncbi:hypothetical protein J2853_002632 [Streptosporangium lutulentum]|uniref:Uncharacterized protein n=1 Tax=Streptosporangium lutulentum TaxID=1461250 RepID=A0ABT9Q9M0_9ACTN|nr:hypothetical protein [Streptosporangium lutulentum]MDP9843421.1 hypothetical protein [Streptosporangium lutulentum]
MPELAHEFGQVGGAGEAVVAGLGRRLVAVTEPAQIGGDDREMLGQQRDQLVPVEMVLRRPVQQKQRFALPGGHVVHADAVDVRPAVRDRISPMIVDLSHRSLLVRILCRSSPKRLGHPGRLVGVLRP